MASLFYPQLASGATAQYPIRKLRLARTVKNVLPDGSMISFSDPNGARLIWELAYMELTDADVEALQAHFNACAGPFHAFTFIDPTDNMLVSSSDMSAAPWVRGSNVQLTTGALDPNGGNAAVTLTNTGQVNEGINQTLQVPSGYQYCFSVYAASTGQSALTATLQGSVAQQNTSLPLGSNWTRLVATGKLIDTGIGLTVGLVLEPGQQVQLYGPQLEAQVIPSRYRPTQETGGVYPSAHWGVDQLSITAMAPDLSSTAFSIETSL
ncbi:MAG: hypothetical protein JO340_21315 [Acidobacteriaceae bacterium]|nr:hypothetical protein [Acidobacteriaceae bacterium]